MRYLILLFISPFLVNGQSLTKLSFDQTQDIDYFRSIKNRTNYSSYATSQGYEIGLGDTLIVARPSTRSLQGNGLGTNGFARFDSKEQQRFEFVQYGKRLILRNNQFFSNQDPDAYPSNRLSKERVFVKEIVAIHKGSRKKPLAVYLVLGELNNRAFGIYKHLTVADVENALAYGEIKLQNMPLSREEAIVKHKEAKELLDLEIISIQEYQKIKAKMSPLINQ